MVIRRERSDAIDEPALRPGMWRRVSGVDRLAEGVGGHAWRLVRKDQRGDPRDLVPEEQQVGKVLRRDGRDVVEASISISAAPAVDALGTASIEIDASTTVTPISSRRFPTLLLLAVEHGREVPRERITTLVFGDQSATEAAHSLRETIYKLRKLGAPIAATRRGFTIASGDVRVDFAEALAAATVDDETLRAMAGGFLPAFVAAKGEAFAEWLDALRAEQTVALTRRLLTDLDDAMRTAQWPTAERLSRACLGLDTWNERATFALAEIVALGGSKANALQLIDRYIAEVGPHSDDLVRRADARRRRISEGLSATLVGVTPQDERDLRGARSAGVAQARGTRRRVGDVARRVRQGAFGSFAVHRRDGRSRA